MKNRIQELEKEILSGNTEAALNLAEIYKWGLYGEVDYRKAKTLYRLCAKSKNHALSAAGYYNLGVLNYYGLGADADLQKAFDCFLKSALVFPGRQALLKLGDMYRYGQFVSQNDVIALSLYEKANHA